MGKKKEVERVVVGGFAWLLEPPVSQPDRERWCVDLPLISVRVTDYGQSDPRGGYFKGWRVFLGAPGADEYSSRDEAMEAAKMQIKRRAKRRLYELNKEVQDGRTLKRRCEEAGLEI